jgi:peptidoglycan hydrolase-like protein with peptidoglycan-binding domain
MRLRHIATVALLLLWAVPGSRVEVDAAERPLAGREGRETSPAQGDDFLKGVQRELKRAGYDPGAQDGKMGPATRYALKRFQRDQGLPVTGEPDVPTLTKLLEHSLRR